MRMSAGYLKYPLRGGEALKEIVDVLCRILEPHQFDAIAFTGMSGALVAPLVSAEMTKPLIMIRKTGFSTHSMEDVEGVWDARTYVIVDDLIFSGHTIQQIYDQVFLFWQKMYRYHGNVWDRPKNVFPECIGVVEFGRIGISQAHLEETLEYLIGKSIPILSSKERLFHREDFNKIQEQAREFYIK
jgi:hypothetical protein